MRSRVIPFFPGIWKAGLRWVSLKASDKLVVDEDKSAEEIVVVVV
jgi:hypothetical protein